MRHSAGARPSSSRVASCRPLSGCRTTSRLAWQRSRAAIAWAAAASLSSACAGTKCGACRSTRCAADWGSSRGSSPAQREEAVTACQQCVSPRGEAEVPARSPRCPGLHRPSAALRLHARAAAALASAPSPAAGPVDSFPFGVWQGSSAWMVGLRRTRFRCRWMRRVDAQGSSR